MDPNQIIQVIAWFVAMVEIVIGLYILALNIWHPANRNVGSLFLVFAVNIFAVSLLIVATDAEQAIWATCLLAATSPTVQVLIFIATLVLLKPEWLPKQRQLTLWTLYVLLLAPVLLTLSDVVWGTQFWYTGLDVQTYAGGYVSTAEFTRGSLSTFIRVTHFYIIPLTPLILILHTLVFDKQARPSLRKLAWLLLGLQIASIIIQMGLSGFISSPIRSIILSIALVIGYAYAAFRQVISERHMQRGNLQTRMTTIILVICIPIVLTIAAMLRSRSGELLEQTSIERLKISNYSLESNVETWLGLNTKALKQLVTLPAIISMDAGEQKLVLEAMAEAYPYMYLVSTTDLQGINVARNDDAAPKDYSDRPWVQGALSGAELTFQTLIGRTSGEPALVASMPIRDQSGAIIGVGMFASDLTTIANEVRVSQIRESGIAYIVDAHNQVIAHPDPAYSSELRDLSSTPPVAVMRQPEGDNITRYTDEDGEHWIAYTQELDNGWGVVVQQKTAEIQKPMQIFQVTSWGAIIIGIVLLGTLTSIAIRQAISPIKSLTDIAAVIANGDLSHVVPVESEDEVGALAMAFNSMTEQLLELIGELEQRVSERTQSLEQRSSQLQAAAEVSQAAASILDTEQLIQDMVDLIREHFKLYYVGLFLVDETREWIVLHAGTGLAGKGMLARQHKIKSGEGMIGWSIANAQARIAQIAGDDAIRLATEELPETRAEAAIPLRSRGQVIGALSVQDTHSDAFDEAAISILQIMADQIGVAIDNAILFTESQRNLEAARRAYGEISLQAWQEIIRGRKDISYRSISKETISTEIKPDIQAGETTIPHSDKRHTLAIPIKVRDTVIGMIDTYKPAQAGEWSSDEIDVIEDIVGQLSVALESARLYEETQQRAESERVIGEITSRMQETLNVETVLKTAVNDIYESLALEQITIQLAEDAVAPSKETAA